MREHGRERERESGGETGRFIGELRRAESSNTLISVTHAKLISLSPSR